MDTLVPQHDRIVVRPPEEEDQTYGNIQIPDMGKDRPEMGTVIAVGPGRTSEYGVLIIPKVNVGEIVLIPRIGFLRVDFNGEDLYVGPDREVLAVVQKYNSLDDRDQL